MHQHFIKYVFKRIFYNLCVYHGVIWDLSITRQLLPNGKYAKNN